MNHGPPAAAGIDIGGTFTDAVVVGSDGLPRGVKVPTTPQDQSEGLAHSLAAASATGVGLVAHGTTTATNAVLERAVARTVLVTTSGFRDLLTVARQDRPSLYDLSVVRPPPLVPAELVVTVAERMASDGTPVIPLADDEVRRVVADVGALSPESIAVCLLFSYANPAHELRLCEALQALEVPITRSSDLLPEFREYERASTCALDAAVAPVMRRYLGRVRERVPEATVTVMTSGGGVADLATVAAAPVLTLLSGPAAGVVAASETALRSGFGDAVAFDMGGTSTDVCLVRDGRPEIHQSGTIGGLPFTTPSVAIHTVGAGGGSIASVDAGGALQVGPRSAGADPGPACYGRGGSAPTVTDAHAVLGHLSTDQPLGDSGLRVDVAAAAAAVRSLPGFDGPAAAAEGIITVVRATMLRALRRVSTERGVDPASLALVAYGGAGPLHATALARDLGCAAAIIPPAPGVLSALGLLLAPPRREVSRTVMARWSRTGPRPDLGPVWSELSEQARRTLPSATLTLAADCRYEGQSHELRLDVTGDEDLVTALDEAHRVAYGYDLPEETVEVVTLRVVAEGAPALPRLPDSWDLSSAGGPDTATIVVAGEDREVPVIPRSSLDPGAAVDGPALIVQPDSTTLLNDGDHAEVAAGGPLVVRW